MGDAVLSGKIYQVKKKWSIMMCGIVFKYSSSNPFEKKYLIGSFPQTGMNIKNI